MGKNKIFVMDFILILRFIDDLLLIYNCYFYNLVVLIYFSEFEKKNLL